VTGQGPGNEPIGHVPGNEPTDDSALAGWRVVVTGDAHRSSELGQRVAERGADVVRLPVVAIEPAPDGGVGLEAAAGRLSAGDYAWVILTSANAVDRLQRALAGRGVPDAVRWAAVGPSTGRAIEAAGFSCHLVPSVATADGLVTELVERATPGYALYPRAERVQSDLAARLSEAGWVVDDVVAYRTSAAVPDPLAREAARGADAVLFTSGSAVKHAVSFLGAEDVPPFVVTIGPSTSAAVRAAGLQVAAEADPHSGDGLIDALVSLARSGARSPRR
jgi:uroporphyrinogen-III synthase